MTEPLRFLAPVTPPDTLGLANATGAFQALPGLLSWVTLDPLFTDAADGATILTARPRVGTLGFTPVNAGVGPTMQMAGKWRGAQFGDGVNRTLQSGNFNPVSYGIALIVHSDGTTYASQNRRAATVNNPGSDPSLVRNSGVWSAAGASAAALPATPGYQLVIWDHASGNGSVRARDTTTTTPTATAAAAAVSAPAQLVLGGLISGTANLWHGAIMEAWLFDSPILTDSARLTAIDQYFQRVYL